MIKIGDIISVQGGRDRYGCVIPPAATWVVVALDPIEGSGLYAVLARGDRPGAGVAGWIAGPVDAVGRPGYPPPRLRADDSILWRLEEIAQEDHAERAAGEVR